MDVSFAPKSLDALQDAKISFGTAGSGNFQQLLFQRRSAIGLTWERLPRSDVSVFRLASFTPEYREKLRRRLAPFLNRLSKSYPHRDGVKAALEEAILHWEAKEQTG